MPNTNAFEQVVHEKKVFKDLSNFSPFWPLKWGQPLHFNKSESPFPRDASCFLVVLEKKSFKGKVDRRTMDAAPSHKLSWPSAR